MRLNDVFLHLKNKLRVSDYELFAEAELIDACSLAYQEVCKELNIFRKSIYLDPLYREGNETFYFKPKDIVAITAISLNGQILSIKSFDFVKTRTVDFVCAYIIAEHIVLVNGTGRINVSYSYTKSLQDLNEELELPSIALDTILNYALYLLKRENRPDSLQRSTAYLQLYENSLGKLKHAISGVQNSKNITSTYQLI